MKHHASSFFFSSWHFQVECKVLYALFSSCSSHSSVPLFRFCIKVTLFVLPSSPYLFCVQRRQKRVVLEHLPPSLFFIQPPISSLMCLIHSHRLCLPFPFFGSFSAVKNLYLSRFSLLFVINLVVFVFPSFTRRPSLRFFLNSLCFFYVSQFFWYFVN